jgi:TP901 family phage tail tape measure protein
MYAAITAGVSTEKAATFVETAAKAAIGGFTSEAVAIDALTSVINAYGLQTEHATAISDRMLLTQNLGKTSFDDMAQAMGKVVPYAAHLGVTVDELFASITSLTGSGSLKTTDAMSSMRAVLTSVINPGKEAAETAKRLGIDFSASALQAKGFVKFLDEISDAAADNQTVLGKLFGSDKADLAVRILTSTGRDAFLGAMDAMRNSAGATEEAFGKMMDTPAKRWEKAMNTMRNAGIGFGTAILPVVEQVTAKIQTFSDSLSKADFTQFRGAADSVVNAVMFIAGAFTWALKTTWTFRGVLLAAGVVLGAYYGVSMLVVGAMNAITVAKNIARAASLAHAIMLGNETAALALLKKGTLGYALVQKALVLAYKARFAVMSWLTGGTLAQTAATAAMAVATGTATAAQWLLNAAMNANPIGLIIVAVATLISIIVSLVKWGQKAAGVILLVGSVIGVIVAGPVALLGTAIGFLISGIVEVTKGWKDVTKAFQDGGILAALKKIFGLLVSGILAPVHSLLEILSYIPNLGHLAGKGAKKIAELRNFLRGDDAITANIKTPKITPEIETPDEVAASVIPDFSGMPAGFAAPVFDLPGFGGAAGSATSGAAGRSKIHGVYDISGAAPALGGPSVSRSQGGMADAARLAVDTAVQSILNLVRSIDGNITRIAAWTFAPEPALIPAPVTQGERTAYSTQERRESVLIELRAAPGTEAEIIRAAPETNIRLIRSGGML